MDYTAHVILQARIVEWVSIHFSRGSSQPRDLTQVSCIAAQILYQLSHQGSPDYMLSTYSYIVLNSLGHYKSPIDISQCYYYYYVLEKFPLLQNITVPLLQGNLNSGSSVGGQRGA